MMKTSVEAGSAAVDAEKDKNYKYRELARSYIFIPVATETMGSWGPAFG